MRNTSPGRPILRFLLGGALLSSLAGLAASCVEALELQDHRDGFADLCGVVDQCFGASYRGCLDRAERFEGAALTAFLEDAPSCLASCGDLYDCLDFPGMCRSGGSTCLVDAECCGFNGNNVTCRGGQCCLPAGAPCTSSGTPCCEDAGACDGVTGTCGGTYCVPPKGECLNDFQCCTGLCQEDKTCAKIPCPPVGFECESNDDCCALVCREGRCAKPDDCALLSQTCSADRPCCDPALTCDIPPGAAVGVCTDKPGCFPDNSDCFSDEQCCNGFCVPEFKLCGSCVKEEGSTCNAATPCCLPLVCSAVGAGDGTCVPAP
jgi:hypothetical protein